MSRENKLQPEEPFETEEERIRKSICYESDEKIPKEVEDQYIRNILEFEKAHATAKKITIAAKIGNPVFPKIETLTSKQLKSEIARFNKLLHKHSLDLGFCQGPYPDEMIYNFMTGEFLNHQIEDIRIKGMMTGFIYEEFHPNHDADISLLVNEFFEGWFASSYHQHSFIFDEHIKLADGELIGREELFKKLGVFFSAFKRFEFGTHTIKKTSRQLLPANPLSREPEGFGTVDGKISYTGVIEHGESIQFEGDYHLGLVRTYAWLINEIRIPGFK